MGVREQVLTADEPNSNDSLFYGVSVTKSICTDHELRGSLVLVIHLHSTHQLSVAIGNRRRIRGFFIQLVPIYGL